MLVSTVESVEAPKEFHLKSATQENRTIILGRAAEADVRLNVPTVSRKHASIEYTSNGCTIKALGFNPIRVNNEKLDKGMERKLNDSDIIVLVNDNKYLVSYKFVAMEPIETPLPSTPIKPKRERVTLSSYKRNIGGSILCDVCQDPIARAHSLQCGHTFCLECIYRWIEKKKSDASCPSCRAPASFKSMNPSFPLDKVVAAVVDTEASPERREFKSRFEEAGRTAIILKEQLEKKVKPKKTRNDDYSEDENSDVSANSDEDEYEEEGSDEDENSDSDVRLGAYFHCLFHIYNAHSHNGEEKTEMFSSTHIYVTFIYIFMVNIKIYTDI
eukprot:GHVL01021380.1.p1 GENE.GHVL01021380.1~~GHVL01021380.1.p1  ORF type:complete len:329 (+),score=57.16 GHVL01021380.1:76-1062(+)